MVSLYSTCSCGLMSNVPGLSLIAWLSDHRVRTVSAAFIR